MRCMSKITPLCYVALSQDGFVSITTNPALAQRFRPLSAELQELSGEWVPSGGRNFHTFTTAPSRLSSGTAVEDRAGEEIGPVALEERSLGPVAPADGPPAASETIAFEPNQDLFGAILEALGTESKFGQRPGPGERDLAPVRAAYRPRPPASPASLDVERKRGEHRFRNDRHLAPLQRPHSSVGPLEGDAALADRAR